MSALTTEQIDAKIGAIDARLAKLKAEAERLSFAAVSGDETAAARLDEIRDEQAKADAERTLLDSAMAEAIRVENAEIRGKTAARKEAALEEGRRLYQRMVDLGRRVDAVCDQFRVLTDEISVTERALKSAAMAAGLPPDGRIGMTGLVVIAKGNLENCMAQGGMVSRPLKEVVEEAWKQFAPPEPEVEEE